MIFRTYLQYALKNFAEFARKHLCESLSFNEVAGLKLWHGCFAAYFAKFLGAHFLQDICGRLLLYAIAHLENHQEL